MSELSGSHQEHARLSPSDSKRWLNCTAAIGYCELNKDRIPPDDSVYATEGTKAHDIAADILTKYFKTGELDKAPDDFKPVDSYVGECVTCFEGDASDLIIMVESRVPLFYGGGAGTADFVVADPEGDWVIVRDLKYGGGVPVSPEDNPQLMIYALSVVEDFDADGLVDFRDDTIVQLDIDQPRHDAGGGSWEIPLSELRAWGEQVKETVAAIRDNRGTFAPSEDSCRWCGAKAFCQSRLSGIMDDPHDPAGALEMLCGKIVDGGAVSDEELAAVFAKAKGIKTYLADVEAYAFQRAESGRPVPGTKLVRGRMGNKAWVDAGKAESWLARYIGPDRWDKKLISPTKAEKAVSTLPGVTERQKTNLAALHHRPAGKLVIAPESDKRPSERPPLDLLND